MNTVTATVQPAVITLPPVPQAETLYLVRSQEWSSNYSGGYKWRTKMSIPFDTLCRAEEEATKMATSRGIVNICIVTIPA